MILYNEKINGSKYPLVFLKTDSGKRINNLIYTVVTNDAQHSDHNNGFCNVKAKVMCTSRKIPAGETNCYLEGNQLFLPDGDLLEVVLLSYEPHENSSTIGFATFTCIAHYE